MFTYKVNNIKVSYKLNASFLKLKLIALSKEIEVSKKSNNFFVLRKNGFVFIIFYTGHVNCTKLLTSNEIESSKSVLIQSVKECSVTETKIDNITASGSIFDNHSIASGRKINLFKLCSFLKVNNVKHRYNPHRFPGLNFKLYGVTFLVFNSGKFILIGEKSLVDLNSTINEFSQFMRVFLGER